jgi:hypothetical protein
MSSTSVLVAQLHDLAEQLLAVDPACLSGDELQSLVVGVQAERARLAVAAGDVLTGWEQRGDWRADGSLRASLALGRDTRTCHRAAGFELRRGRMLMDMPVTRAAVLEGRLSIDHVDLFLRHATPERWQRFLDDEAALVAVCAATRLFGVCRQVLRYWAQRVDDELELQRTRPAPSTLSFSRTGDTGEGVLNGVLAPIDAEIVENELKRLMADIKAEDTAAGRSRTKLQRRAAALVRMASCSINAHGPSARPLFQFIGGDLTAGRLCELASGRVVHPDDLEPFIDTALVESFLFDGPMVVIAKSKQRTFTGALRKAILVRDRRCTHRSGCPADIRDCDVDHYQPASRGGPTSQFNGRAECHPHNRIPHLHDHPDSDDPLIAERPVTILDALRCRIRWQVLRDPDDSQLRTRWREEIATLMDDLDEAS